MRDCIVSFEVKNNEICIRVEATVAEFLTAIEDLLYSYAERSGRPVEEMMRMLNLGVAVHTVRRKKQDGGEASDRPGQA